MSTSPLADTLARAIAAQSAAIEAESVAGAAYEACACACADAQAGVACAHLLDAADAAFDAVAAASAAVDAARAALADSDEPREWLLSDGHAEESVAAASAEEACTEAEVMWRAGDWASALTSTWIDVRVYCEATGEEGSVTVEIEAVEPPCCKPHKAHDWQAPYEIVGGLRENPGVWGHGGGALIHEVCMRCGCARITDTWAQRPDTGEQGLTEVSYEPERYTDDLERYEAERAEEVQS